MSANKIEAAALRWIEARIEADRLRELRNAIECVDEPDDDPCWKIVGHTAPEGDPVFNQRPDKWCPRCRERQDAHARFVRYRPLVGGRLSALNRLSKAEHLRRTAALEGADDER